jgi:serine protease Do
MKNLKLLILFTLTLSAGVDVFGQKADLKDLQLQTKQAIEKVYPACVRIWGFDTVRKVQNSSQFSGVVVSEDGHILTVAHAIVPLRTYKVLFPDGKEVLAVALGRMGLKELQTRPDLGMLKITSKGSWPVAAMGYSGSLKTNQPCISISYPETLNQPKPTVRLGRVSQVKDQFGFVNSTCKMEPGDSGGPLFDLKGRVIAMHSRCREAEEENLEVPIDLYRKYWKSLQVAEDYQALPLDTAVAVTDPLPNKGLYLDSQASISNPFLESLMTSCLTIKSSVDGETVKVNGTLLKDRGKSFVMSKGSMVGEHPKIVIGSREFNANILFRDQENDIVLLVVNDKISGGIEVSKINESSVSFSDLGTYLFSPLPAGQSQSIISGEQFALPRKFSAGFLGGPARYIDGKITLSVPVKDSPTELSGLKQGDVLMAIGEVKLDEPADYGREMMKYNPGDTVVIKAIREGTEILRRIKLDARPKGSHVADQFFGGKSVRLDGFSKVFSHDGIITPEECGGPVFDSNGRFYGVNIARFSRTTTLVMPAQVLISIIKNASMTNRKI